MNTRLMKHFRGHQLQGLAVDSDIKRENANINGDTAMGAMLKFGSEGAKQFYDMYVLDPQLCPGPPRTGDIHIHDKDFYTLTTTCCQIELSSAVPGRVQHRPRLPCGSRMDIASYSALACIAIQANQNDQHGGQSIVNFDYGMARRREKDLSQALPRQPGPGPGAAVQPGQTPRKTAEKLMDLMQAHGRCSPRLEEQTELPGGPEGASFCAALSPTRTCATRMQDFAQEKAAKETDRATYQAMEALIHNLNTMNSRAGAQVPFSSINYGMDTSPEGRMVVRNVLLATEAGLGNGETPIFPIQIFRVKEGVNYNPGDPNYDLFQPGHPHSAPSACSPTSPFWTRPINLKYYKPGHPETEIAYMGCRTRVMGNVYDPSREIAPGRGNLSFTSINLPRIAIKARGDVAVVL